MNDPKVSVIVPFYNAGATLDRTLESIASLSYHNIEILLVDDSSTDNGYSIADAFAGRDTRFKVERNTENRGVSFCRNRGLERATGRFIVFVDGDDRISADWIQNLLTDALNTKAEIVIGRTRRLDGEQESDYEMTGLDRRGPLDFKTLVLKDNSVVWNKLFSADLLRREKLRFEESLCIGEDLLFCFQAMSRARGIFYSDRGCYYYQAANDRSIMGSSSTAKRVRNLSRLLELLVKYCEQIGHARHPILGTVAKDILRIHYKNTREPLDRGTLDLIRAIDPNLPFKVRFTIFRKSIGRALVGRSHST